MTIQPSNHRRLKTSRRRRRPLANRTASYARFSSDLQDEASIESQQEACREFAGNEGKEISPDLEYVDRAISGTVLHRDGLDALRDAAEDGRFDTLIVYSMSRLARESTIALTLIKRLVYLGIRVVSIIDGFDSGRAGWEMHVHFTSMQSERFLADLSANVFRGQAANIGNGFANGDHCLGYETEPAPGSDGSRRSRHGKQRMVYVIDPVAERWVQQIFTWFVHERRSLRWIAQELNRLKAPKDHRATTSQWHHQYLHGLLSNTKYIGVWPWGKMKNVRDPETGIVMQEHRSADETDKWVRNFPDLQIIDDATFIAAQDLLRQNRVRFAHRHRDDGSFSEDQSDRSLDYPAHLLSGLILCSHCGRRFSVGGTNGNYMHCPIHSSGGLCPVKTTVRTVRAEELILAAVGNRLLAKPAWRQAVLNFTKAAWAQHHKSLPDELRDTERALADLNQKIKRLINSLEDQDDPDPEVRQRLADRRAERQTLEANLERLRKSTNIMPTEPTAAWIDTQLNSLHDVLSSATPAAAHALRDLVGGAITVEEIKRPGRKRHFLRATFTLKSSVLVTNMAQPDVASAEDLTETISIDLLPANPRDELSEQVKALWDQGLPNKDIAAQLGLHRSQITILLRHWSDRHGEALPNGFTRRSERAKKQLGQPRAREIADKVKELVDQGLLLGEIATRLDKDRDTITAAHRYWHESRGLPVSDGRTRRKELVKKVLGPRRPNGSKQGA